jgi:lipopolysaccharide biosynthesis protein
MRSLAKVLELVAPRICVVKCRWLRRPAIADGDKICIFVAYAPTESLSGHAAYHAQAWASAGFKVIVVLNVEDFHGKPAKEIPFAAGVLVRENRGYDFGAWASALHQLPAIRSASIVALTNDSMYGPFDTFEGMLERVRRIDADVIGATESQQLGWRHFQSYLLFFKPRALTSEVFWRFWANVRAGGRLLAVNRYELGMLRAMERGGLRCVALYPKSGVRNPTLTRWRSLVEDGLPYVKVALLRDNHWDADLTGWRNVLSEHGYDPALVVDGGAETPEAH